MRRPTKKKKLARKKKLTKTELALLTKVRAQLQEMKQPVEQFPRNVEMEIPISVFEYIAMDPMWQSTMGGQFAGRVIQKGSVWDRDRWI